MTALPEAFWAKTSRTDCIVWVGAQNSGGYGCFAVDGKSQLAHRVAYEAAHGAIPEGMTIDHLCRVRSCVNVDHLEVVTMAENTRRARRLDVGGECQRGHVAATEADIYFNPRGSRECRACRDSYIAERAGGNDIRKWARGRGIPVKTSGRLPRSVINAYMAAGQNKAS